MDTSNSNETGRLSLANAAAALEMPAQEGQQEIESATVEDTEVESEVEELEDTDEGQEIESEADEEAESDEEEAEEDDEAPQVVTVKVDGQEVEVTLDELKSGYSRTADYTKKTQELAAQRKQFEAEIQAVSQERQTYQQLLSVMAQQINQESEPDWDYLRQTDPIEYSLQMADWQRKQQKRQVVEQEQQRLQQLQQVETQKQMAQRLQQEAEALSKLVPEWNNPEKAKEVKAMIREQGKKLGFTDEELGNVTDHRAVLALRKAALYDQMMSKRQNVQPNKPNSAVVKPGSKATPGRTSEAKKLSQQLSKTGSKQAAAQLLGLLTK